MAQPPLGRATCAAAAVFPVTRKVWLHGAGHCRNLLHSRWVEAVAPGKHLRGDLISAEATPFQLCPASAVRPAGCRLPGSARRWCPACMRSVRWGCLPALCIHTVLARDSLCAGCHVSCHGTPLHSTELLHASRPSPFSLHHVRLRAPALCALQGPSCRRGMLIRRL